MPSTSTNSRTNVILLYGRASAARLLAVVLVVFRYGLPSFAASARTSHAVVARQLLKLVGRRSLLHRRLRLPLVRAAAPLRAPPVLYDRPTPALKRWGVQVRWETEPVMGVKGGWDKLRECGQPVSLAKLGYDCILHKKRRYRLAIDMGLWLKHADWGQGAAEPELRTIYYRLLKLLDAGIAPLLVLDGPHRPKFKRGNYIWGGKHSLQDKVVQLADALGVEVRLAPGEAEAEAALLAKEGVVDAVLTDDVDVLMFGAPVCLRNWSTTTSGAKAEVEGDRRNTHCVRYDTARIAKEVPELNADGLAFFALLSGGDYSDGLRGCGTETALGLIAAGLHRPFLDALRTLHGPALQEALADWRQRVRQELCTNTSGKLKSKKPALAKSMPEDFPSVEVARAYLQPVTSATTTDSRFRKSTALHTFRGRIDVAKVCHIMTTRFDYNHALILNKITRGLRRPLLMRQFADVAASSDGSIDLEWRKYLTQIEKGVRGYRAHTSTDSTPEYRLALDIAAKWPYVALAESHLVHPDPNIGKADMWRMKDNGPDAILKGDFEQAKTEENPRIWMAVELLEHSATGRKLIAQREELKSTSPSKRPSSPSKKVSRPASPSKASASSSSPARSEASLLSFLQAGSSQTSVSGPSPSRKSSSEPLDLDASDTSLPDANIFAGASSPTKMPRKAHGSTPRKGAIEISDSESDEAPDVLSSPSKRKRTPTKRPQPKLQVKTGVLFGATPATSAASRGVEARAQSTLAFPVASKELGKARSKTPEAKQVAVKQKVVIDLD